MLECTFYFFAFSEAFPFIADCAESCQAQNSPVEIVQAHKKRNHTDNSTPFFIVSAARFVFLFDSPNSFFHLAMLVNFTSWHSHGDSDGYSKKA